MTPATPIFSIRGGKNFDFLPIFHVSTTPISSRQNLLCILASVPISKHCNYLLGLGASHILTQTPPMCYLGTQHIFEDPTQCL